MISARHWWVASCLAVSVHVGAFYAIFYSPVEGSQGAGNQGIEFDLGMMGDLGESLETSAVQEQIQESEETLEEPIEKVEPEVVEERKVIVPELAELESTVKSEPVVDPAPTVFPEPIEVKQASPIDLEKVELKPTVQSEPIVETEPAVKPEPTPEAQPEPNKFKKRVVNVESKQVSSTSIANLKATTGTGNSVSNGGNLGAKANYTTKLLSIFAKNKRYPRASRRRSEEGTVTLSFVVYDDGSVSDVSIIKSAGHKRLDKAVLDMIRKSSPLPKFSNDMIETELKIRLPVSFKLDDFR